MPGASQNTSAAILSSVAFDKHALNFATAGVSKRISVYNYADAVTTYAVGQTGEVRWPFQLQFFVLPPLKLPMLDLWQTRQPPRAGLAVWPPLQTHCRPFHGAKATSGGPVSEVLQQALPYKLQASRLQGAGLYSPRGSHSESFP